MLIESPRPLPRAALVLNDAQSEVGVYTALRGALPSAVLCWHPRWSSRAARRLCRRVAVDHALLMPAGTRRLVS